MHIIPTPDEAARLRALFDGNPVVAAAEQAVRRFGDVTREQAAELLCMWRHTPELSDRERAAVLARFASDPARVDLDNNPYPHVVPLGEGNSGPGGEL